MRVLVVGAGVVGSSIAFRLAEGGADVIVVEADTPGSGTTGRSFAWLNANSKPPDPYHHLNAEGIQAHRRLASTLGGAPWLHLCGNLRLTERADAEASLVERVERLQRLEYPAELIDRARAEAIEPRLDLSRARRIAWFPEEGWADGPKIARALVDAAAERGARVLTGRRVTRIEGGSADDGARVTVADSSGSEEVVVANRVVLAVGRFSDEVASLAGVSVPLAPSAGLLAITSLVDEAPTHVVYGDSVHFRPTGDGRMMIQSDDTDASTDLAAPPHPTGSSCLALLERARRLVPALADAHIEEARVGLRAYPADGFPLVGPIAQTDWLYLAVTHSGMTLGPLLGEIVSREVLSGEADEWLRTFRPERLVQVD